MSVLDRVLARVGLQRYSLQQWISETALYGGHAYPVMPSMTLTSDKQEKPSGSFESYVQGIYKTNGVVFACMAARMLMFSEARFQFRRFIGGRPEELFGNESLRILEQPWTNATTGDMLARLMQDVDLAGNGYDVLLRGKLRRPRPDWMTIVVGSPNDATEFPGDDLDAEIAGYFYHRGGINRDSDPLFLRPEQVAHFAPYPDPAFRFRGMSWLTPVLQDIMGDAAATSHKLKFFEGGATPNMIVALDKTFNNKETYEAFIKKMREEHEGVANAYKTLYLGAGATATVVGSNFQQIDFKKVQGGGETRIASVAGVPPILVGLSEGLDAATYSNYGMAKRAFAQVTLSPLWRNVAGSFDHLVNVPAGAQLWYDVRDIPFLQEDQKDAAQIFQIRSQAASALISAGFEPKSIVAAVDTGDITRLKHTGLYSVQLQPPMPEGPPKPVIQADGAQSASSSSPLAALPAPKRDETRPVGPYPDFATCVKGMMKKQDYDEKTARKVCGKMEQQSLTDRQRDISEMLDEGIVHKQIAAELGLSLRTVAREAAVIRQWHEMAGAVI
jgi:phage portal protein BeeE/uncharacterized protein YerC